jgi:hypothetical protein
LKEDLQQLGQVTYGDNDFVYAVALQLPQQNLQDGHISDGHQWLGEYFCIWG